MINKTVDFQSFYKSYIYNNNSIFHQQIFLLNN